MDNLSSSNYDRKGNSRFPKWIIALLFVFIFSILGAGVSLYLGTIIPFWLLCGFSVVYAAGKWLKYQIDKYLWLGRLYKLGLNLAILSLCGLIVWSGVELFSHQFLKSAIAGSVLFFAEFGLFLWLWGIVSLNRRRRPGMVLTIFTLSVLFLVFAFAGVQPMSTYKDTALNKIQTAFKYDNPPVYPDDTTMIPSPGGTQTTSGQTGTDAKINVHTGIYNNYFLGLVHSPEGVLSGDGCYDDSGNFIILINNRSATDPTYAELVAFLKSDQTDQYPYIYTHLTSGTYYGTAESHVDLKNIQNIIDGTDAPENPYICSDFAERLHNDAEMAGIRCGYVSLDMSGYSDPANLGIPANSGHACDVFQTTDKGLIYVDDTGMPADMKHPSKLTSTVKITVGQQYIPINLFPERGWQSAAQSMGTVTNMYVTWDGEWKN
jgi:hypothetical protein